MNTVMTRFLSVSAIVSMAVICTLFWVPVAQAQLLQGSLKGDVRDSTQAAIIGGKVTITNQATNASRETVTNEAGGYNFPTVNTGTYTLEVTVPGFQTHSQTGVIISINNVTRASQQPQDRRGLAATAHRRL